MIFQQTCFHAGKHEKEGKERERGRDVYTGSCYEKLKHVSANLQLVKKKTRSLQKLDWRFRKPDVDRA